MEDQPGYKLEVSLLKGKYSLKKRELKNPQMSPPSVHISLLTTYLSSPVVFIRVFPDTLKLIPNSLLNYLHYSSTENPHCARHYTPQVTAFDTKSLPVK